MAKEYTERDRNNFHGDLRILRKNSKFMEEIDQVIEISMSAYDLKKSQ